MNASNYFLLSIVYIYIYIYIYILQLVSLGVSLTSLYSLGLRSVKGVSLNVKYCISMIPFFILLSHISNSLDLSLFSLASGLFAAVYLATFLISNIVTNNAAAALIFPIAMDAAVQTGTDVVLMSYCVMLGASASFMSPFGYTTNLMIYGPGGYKYNDFLVVGTPMQLVLWIVTVFLLATTTNSNFYISWLVSFGILAFFACATICDFKALLRPRQKNAILASDTQL